MAKESASKAAEDGFAADGVQVGYEVFAGKMVMVPRDGPGEF